MMDDTIRQRCPRHAMRILYYLEQSNIWSWSDMTNGRLNDFRDALVRDFAPNTAKTYMAELRAAIGKTDAQIPANYQSVLKMRADKPLKTYLNSRELGKLEGVQVRTDKERGILYTFLVSAYTGCRISDASALTSANIHDGILTYVSQKTATRASVPCGTKVMGWINWLERNKFHSDLPTYNAMIRSLCCRAGIKTSVSIYRAGKHETKPKWECITSHTGRISFATNMAQLRTPVLEISRMMGHSSVDMTSRYIVEVGNHLTAEQMQYFK